MCRPPGRRPAPSRRPAWSASPRPAPPRPLQPRRAASTGSTATPLVRPHAGRPRRARGCTARPRRRRPACARATPRCRRRAAPSTVWRGRGGTPTPCGPWRRSRPAARHRRRHEPVVEQLLVGRQEEQLRHRDREVAVGQLDQQAVAELAVVAQEGQLVLVAAGALELAGVGSAAAGPRRAGRGRCWPARCPPPSPARGRTTRQPLRRDQRVVAEAAGRTPTVRLICAPRPPGTS